MGMMAIPPNPLSGDAKACGHPGLMIIHLDVFGSWHLRVLVLSKELISSSDRIDQFDPSMDNRLHLSQSSEDDR